MRALRIFAIAAAVVSSTLAAAGQELIPPTAVEKSAPLVEGHIDSNDKHESGVPWLYVRVRHPETGALFAVRVVLKPDGKTYAESRLLERPRLPSTAAAR